MRVRLLWLGSLWVLLALPAARASAQQWLSDRARTEGRGIQVGPLVLHPGIGSEIGWDSNVFLAEHDPVDRAEDSAILRVSPHFDIATPGEGGKLSFRTGAYASLRHYFATDIDTTVDVGEKLTLKWQAAPVFAWEIFQDLKRTATPFTDPAGPANTSSAANSFGRNQVGVGTRVQLSTASQLLKGGLAYRLDFDIFDDSAFDANDTRAHTVSADTSWEFLPKTALVWGGAVKFREYQDPGAAPAALGERNDSTDTSTRMALNGALTDRLGFTVGVGYAAGFYDDGGDYENLLAQIQTRYKLSQNASFALGYQRTTVPSYFGNSSDTDTIQGELKAMFGGVFLLGVQGSFAFMAFGTDDALGAEGRVDRLLVTNVSGEYRFTDWFAVTGDVGYSQNFSAYEYPAMGTMVPADPAKWRKIEAWLGVRAFL